MHDLFGGMARRLTAVLLTLCLALAACSGGATPAAESSEAPPAGGSNAGAQLSPGDVDVQGSLVSSGLYDATWKWQTGNAAGVGIGGVTLNSDKGTFSNIEVLADGSITFSSGAPELTAGSYSGTGAEVHLKDVQGAMLPCSFTLDNDVTGSDGGVLHLKGTLTIIGTPFNC